MAMAYLNGELSVINGRKERKEKRKDKRAVRRTKIKEKLKKGLKVVGKVGLAPARAGFLLAVDLNVLKLAKRLEQAYKKHPDEIKKFWDKFGGNWDKLKSAINKGAKANINGIKPSEMGSAAAAISSATPIIIAVVKLFRGLKTDKAGDDKEDTKGLKDLGDELLTGEDSNVVTRDENGKEENVHGGTPFYKNPMVLGIGAVALIGGYMLMKKRK